MTLSQKRVLDLPQAAARLGLSWHQAYSLVLRGKIRGERRAGRWMIDKASVERLLREQQRQDEVVGGSLKTEGIVE